MSQQSNDMIDRIVKAYDVRGLVDSELTPDVAYKLGVGFALFVKDNEPDVDRIVVGRDMRDSGVALSQRFTDAVRSNGLGVADIGLASTDMIYFASGAMGLPGVMFTASHNPAEYNGMKMCLSQARPIGIESGLDQIKKYAQESSIGDLELVVGELEAVDLLDGFAEHVQGFVRSENMAPLKIVVDTANGMGGYIVERVFEPYPFDLEVMYGELDGSFPNHEANPIEPANLVDLQRRISETGADVGLAFDGDADRVILVDEKAQAVSGSTTTAILAEAMLKKHNGAHIIHNLICSKAVPEVIEENGGKAIRSRVGHSFIKAEMASTGAVFGGEHSAHYYFKDNWRADSGIIAAAIMLEKLSLAKMSLSEMCGPFRRYHSSGEINTEVSDPGSVLDRLESQYGSENCDRLDGLTVDLGDWWFNVRPSNTEPLLRLNLETSDRDELDNRTKEVLEYISS